MCIRCVLGILFVPVWLVESDTLIANVLKIATFLLIAIFLSHAFCNNLSLCCRNYAEYNKFTENYRLSENNRSSPKKKHQRISRETHFPSFIILGDFDDHFHVYFVVISLYCYSLLRRLPASLSTIAYIQAHIKNTFFSYS